MADFLLEIYSEEMPAGVQQRAAEQLHSGVTALFVAGGLRYAEVTCEVTPRRLVAFAAGVAARSSDTYITRKGPRVGAPVAAVQGFLRASGLASIEECEIKADAKGEYYLANITRAGRDATELLAEQLPQLLAQWKWEKSMRWGEYGARFRWVRPLRSILCLFGDGEAEMAPVVFTVGTVSSGDTTHLGEQRVKIDSIAHYKSVLDGAGVILSRAERLAAIKRHVAEAAFALGLKWAQDNRLAEEVAGLVESPHSVLCSFDSQYLSMPPEIAVSVMRHHQKYFTLLEGDGLEGDGLDGAGLEGAALDDTALDDTAHASADNHRAGKLSNHFVVIANNPRATAHSGIAAGNRRVVQARLGDARFYWDRDVAGGLQADVFEPALADTLWHSQLGTQLQRRDRLVAMASALARDFSPPSHDDNADVSQRLTKQAATYSLADLVSGTVGEFPDLQGIVGREIARANGLPQEVAIALEQQYWPKAADGELPAHVVGKCLAAAQRLDALAGFWKIGQKPTGSSDPFALRRAADGLVRILYHGYDDDTPDFPSIFDTHIGNALAAHGSWSDGTVAAQWRHQGGSEDEARRACQHDLSRYLCQRFMAQVVREGLSSAEVAAAVLDLNAEGMARNPQVRQLGEAARRCAQLERFLSTGEAARLLEVFRRASNILADADATADANAAQHTPHSAATGAPHEDASEEEIALGKEVRAVEAALAQAADYRGKLEVCIRLAQPLGVFFDNVIVMADNAAARRRRLGLLSSVRELLLSLADFGKINQTKPS